MPEHEISLYFERPNRPVVFVNTSNHAFAEYDNNPYNWKFEFISTLTSDRNDCLISTGCESREELEDYFQSKYEVIARIGEKIEMTKFDPSQDQELICDWICYARKQFLLNEKIARELVQKAFDLYSGQ